MTSTIFVMNVIDISGALEVYFHNYRTLLGLLFASIRKQIPFKDVYTVSVLLLRYGMPDFVVSKWLQNGGKASILLWPKHVDRVFDSPILTNQKFVIRIYIYWMWSLHQRGRFEHKCKKKILTSKREMKETYSRILLLHS